MVRGVGVIGAGPGVRALHLPTLARLPGNFAVVHISDSGSGRAIELAEQLHAQASTGIAELLADPEVDVVAICSPPALHSSHILASVAAGVKAVLCEKPIALTGSDAEAVVEACRAAGTVLVVGTNHLFDPAWGRAKHHLDGGGGPVHTVSVTLALPPNARYHDLVTELGDGSAPSHRAPDWSDAAVAASIVRQLVLGLGIHDLPALRDIVPSLDEVVYARPLPPLGYAIGVRGGDTLVTLTAVMLPDGADALWRMSIGTSLDRLDVEFPPGFVHAGSARARVSAPDGRVTEYPPAQDDGYIAEWRALAAVLDEGRSVEYDDILEDALYAVRLADAAHAAVLDGYAR
ncbi:Gfo/Idh/MocA family protein [Lacisediminihabitans sp.]|uniref:Gfo/Idh/MocA family protein n=1 Tax=Lacisediminihabitans sp. TaxID=2787631 RepID=UPI00374CEB82